MVPTRNKTVWQKTWYNQRKLKTPMFLTDLFFPTYCLNCGFLGSYICLKCQGKLAVVERDTCFYCRKSSLHGLTHPICKRRYGIEGFVSVFYYTNVLKRIIKNIKYRLARKAVRELFLLIPPPVFGKLAFFAKKNSFFIQQIPLHAVRYKQRGFNQASIIADFISEVVSEKSIDVLKRVRATGPQSSLSGRRQRYQNIRNAFEVQKGQSVENLNILLVDDVLTSGATIAEAARTLKKSGAERVFAFTLARG